MHCGKRSLEEDDFKVIRSYAETLQRFIFNKYIKAEIKDRCADILIDSVAYKCRDTEKIIVLIKSSKGQSSANARSGYAMIGTKDILNKVDATETAHEFGHLLGLDDEYAVEDFSYCGAPNCGNINLYIYPPNQNPGIIANPNPCSKWCDSVKPAIEYAHRDCLNRKNKQKCNEYVLGGPWCVWLPEKDLFFDSQCVMVEGHENICSDVKDEYQQYEQVGCYYGAGGQLKWRSTDHSCVMYNDNYGEFSPVSTKYIKEYFKKYE